MSRHIFLEKSIGYKFIAKAVSCTMRKCVPLTPYLTRRAKVINSFVRIFYRAGVRTQTPCVNSVCTAYEKEKRRKRRVRVAGAVGPLNFIRIFAFTQGSPTSALSTPRFNIRRQSIKFSPLRLAFRAQLNSTC